MWKFANFLIKMIFGMSKSFCRSTILAYSDIRITVSSISVQPFISFRLFRRVQFRNRVTFKFYDNIFKLFILLLHTLSLSVTLSHCFVIDVRGCETGTVYNKCLLMTQSNRFRKMNVFLIDPNKPKKSNLQKS